MVVTRAGAKAERLGVGFRRALETKTLWVQKRASRGEILTCKVGTKADCEDLGAKTSKADRTKLLSEMIGLRRNQPGEDGEFKCFGSRQYCPLAEGAPVSLSTNPMLTMVTSSSPPQHPVRSQLTQAILDQARALVWCHNHTKGIIKTVTVY